jgi:uracil-DNA glycosylase family 4
MPDSLDKIASEVRVCLRCPLGKGRTHAVPGEGPANPRIMFIGEGPGYHEDMQGRPFVGASGQYLEELLAGIRLRRKDVFIANVVKCRPPGNRDPQPEELGACGEYLERQIEAINPRVIVTLGRFSMARFLPNARISDVHGQPFWNHGRLVVPMYHPAAALHQPSLKTSVERDFTRLTDYIQQARAAAPKASAPPAAASNQAQPPEEGKDDQPTQLSLF